MEQCDQQGFAEMDRVREDFTWKCHDDTLLCLDVVFVQIESSRRSNPFPENMAIPAREPLGKQNNVEL